MARIKLTFPDPIYFHTRIPVRITDLNYGGHLGNDALLGLVHEARVRFLWSLGVSEKDFFGTGLIMADAALEYKSEGFYGDELQFELGLGDLSGHGFELYYRVTTHREARLLALVRTGMVCYDYAKKKVAPLPAAFLPAVQARLIG